MSFDRLKFVNLSDQDRQRKKKRANKLELEGLINDGSNVKFLETIFPKKNESKNLFNVTCDRDLVMCNTSKYEEEKTKSENGKNSDINLTTKLIGTDKIT